MCENSSPDLRRQWAEKKECSRERLRAQRSLLSQSRGGMEGNVGGREGELRWTGKCGDGNWEPGLLAETEENGDRYDRFQPRGF